MRSLRWAPWSCAPGSAFSNIAGNGLSTYVGGGHGFRVIPGPAILAYGPNAGPGTGNGTNGTVLADPGFFPVQVSVKPKKGQDQTIDVYDSDWIPVEHSGVIVLAQQPPDYYPGAAVYQVYKAVFGFQFAETEREMNLIRHGQNHTVTGASSMLTANVSIPFSPSGMQIDNPSATPGQLNGVLSNRVSVNIENTGSVTVYISAEAGSTLNGLQLGPGQNVQLLIGPQVPIWAYVASGTGTVVLTQLGSF
jgi:hypothetical protein